MLLRSLSLVLVLSLTAQVPTRANPPEISEAYKLFHNIAVTLAMSVYYTGSDSNKLNADITQWQFDWVTQFNILWRSLLFAPINYAEFSYFPDSLKSGTVSAEQIAYYRGWIFFVASTSQMVTYNSRYDEVVVSRFNDYESLFRSLGEPVFETLSATLAGLAVVLRNVGWFYVFPNLLKPVNAKVLSLLPRQQNVADMAYVLIPCRIVQFAVFSAMDLLYKHLLMSVKSTAWQFLPTAQDLRIFRFDDCTLCYFGTNMMGKSGAIGSKLRAARDFVVEAVYPAQHDEL